MKTYADECGLRLLESIQQLALVLYPYPDEVRHGDPGIPFALGQIAGIASKVLNHHRQQPRPPVAGAPIISLD